MFDFGILGNNARNLHYIKKWNPKKEIRLADNKLQTKKFLGERGIPFAETYAVIKTRKQLAELDFSQLQKKYFVIKPNHGSKGRGILIGKSAGEVIEQKKESRSSFGKLSKFFGKMVSRIKKSDFHSFFKREEDQTIKKSSAYFEIQGKTINENDLRRNLLDILDGKFSMTTTDQVIIEEKLIPGEGFKEFCEFGLADLRIISFNLVPVAGMIRIPTKKSGGKANLNAGGLGCGIDIGSGKITSILYKNKIYTEHFPIEFAHYQGKKIPFWNDLLFLSSKVQYFVNLGYLALDWVITNNGPKLLEINARAGLEVQKIADIKLKKVLEKLNDMKIQDPEKGVEIAKTLFSKDNLQMIKNSKILYLSQQGKLKLYIQDAQENYDILVKVDLQKSKNQISSDLQDRINHIKTDQIILELPDNDIILKNLKFELGEGEQTITLGQKTASKFLLKPIKKESETINILNPKKIITMELAELHLIDDKVEKMAKRLNLTARLRPINYFNELDRFIGEKGNYNPIFEYKFPSLELQKKRNDELLFFQEQLKKSYLKSPLLHLFEEKIDELIHRAILLKAYTDQNFTIIEKENLALFGNFDEKLIKLSKEKLFNQNEQQIEEKNLTFMQIRERVEKYLAEKGIFGVEIVENISNFSRMSVSMGKSLKINIARNIQLSENELKSLLAHEVDIHLVRYLNGLKSGWNIFRSGTGYYLKDEEGFAVWNAMQVLPEGEENLSIYKKYYLLAESKKYSFSKMKDLAYFLSPEKNLERIFKGILRCKKGQILTSENIGSYLRTKDKVYLDGYEKIKGLKINDKSLEVLKKGKIKIEDQIFISN